MIHNSLKQFVPFSDNEHFVYLKNTGNLPAFKNTSDIVQQLPTDFAYNKHHYNVGLLNLRYTSKQPKSLESNPTRKGRERRFKRSRKTFTPLHHAAIPVGPLFPDYKNPIIAEYPIRKQSKETLYEFTEKFNNGVGKLINVLIAQTYVDADGKKFVPTLYVKNQDTASWVLFSNAFASLFGFNRRSFFEGAYVGNQQFSSLFAFHKNLDEQFKPFFTRLTSVLGKRGLNVMFSFDTENKCTMIVSLPTSNPLNYIILPQELLDSLGFNNDRFYFGTKYTSDTPFNSTAFDNIIPLKNRFINARYFSLQFLAMKEPKSQSIGDVFTELNNTFIDQHHDQFPIQFSYDDGEIILNEIPPDVTIQLPADLRNYFGLPIEAEFKRNSRFPARKMIVEQEEEIEWEEEHEGDADILGSKKRFLVLSNIIENQTYEGQKVPILRELNFNEDYNNETEVNFNPVIYLPLRNKQVTEARINFVDENLKPIDFGDAETAVTLHFKPKYA
ncbi:unnamed protein product [Allacma fusca]|uniref:Uncharacterized protein n=1 Tax=Allacma fusca TaxID=39272 RepID=A0A8J2K5W4_9HEXA|nr:unnamed protein product [Allacma fusca]